MHGSVIEIEKKKQKKLENLKARKLKLKENIYLSWPAENRRRD